MTPHAYGCSVPGLTRFAPHHYSGPDRHPCPPAPIGGERGIRTPGRVAPTLAFQASPFSHSDISPQIGRKRTSAATASLPQKNGSKERQQSRARKRDSASVLLAERGGFEPPVGLPLHWFSKPARSATPAPLPESRAGDCRHGPLGCKGLSFALGQENKRNLPPGPASGAQSRSIQRERRSRKKALSSSALSTANTPSTLW